MFLPSGLECYADVSEMFQRRDDGLESVHHSRENDKPVTVSKRRQNTEDLDVSEKEESVYNDFPTSS